MAWWLEFGGKVFRGKDYDTNSMTLQSFIVPIVNLHRSICNGEIEISGASRE